MDKETDSLGFLDSEGKNFKIFFAQPVRPFEKGNQEALEEDCLARVFFLENVGEGGIFFIMAGKEKHELLVPQTENFPLIIADSEQTTRVVYPYGLRELQVYLYLPLEASLSRLRKLFCSLKLPQCATQFFGFLDEPGGEVWPFTWLDMQKRPCLPLLPNNPIVAKGLTITFFYPENR